VEALLPASFKHRRANRGLENLAVSGDKTRAYTCQQSTMDGGGTSEGDRGGLGAASHNCDTDDCDIRYSRVIRCAILDISEPTKVGAPRRVNGARGMLASCPGVRILPLPPWSGLLYPTLNPKLLPRLSGFRVRSCLLAENTLCALRVPCVCLVCAWCASSAGLARCGEVFLLLAHLQAPQA